MKIDNVKIYGLEESIVASGYPLRTNTDSMTDLINSEDKELSSKHLTRAINLGSTQVGSGHSQYLIGIIVQFDLTFTLKAWIELERYHFIDFVSSQSTMHCINKFDLRSQYNEYVDERIIIIMEELKDKYNETKDKKDYLRLLYSNPSGFQLTARMTTNYSQLKTICPQRKHHKLPEWREFCKWALTLPMFKQLTGLEE
jgi:hypothetical protein